MKKIFKTIYYIVLTGLIAIALLFIVSVFPVTGNIKLMTVLSGSMEPKIHTGSIVVVKSVADYKVGDIITFGQNTKTEVPTTHRIAEVKVENGEMVYKTKGDANNGEDNKEVSRKDIIGKVYFSLPYLGYAIDFVKKPFGLMIVIVIPAIIIIYDEINKIGREVKKLKLKVKKVEEEVEEIEEEQKDEKEKEQQ